MNNFKATVSVRQLCDNAGLDFDDEMDFGECGKGGHVGEFPFSYDHQPTEDEVLDEFHETIAISNLENYSVSVVSIKQITTKSEVIEEMTKENGMEIIRIKPETSSKEDALPDKFFKQPNK